VVIRTSAKYKRGLIHHQLASTCLLAFSALMLLVGWQEGHPACKITERWGAGVVVCLELGADLHMVQLMPLPLTVSCFSRIQIGFTFLVLAHPGSPGHRAVKRVCVWLVFANINQNSYAIEKTAETTAHRDIITTQLPA